MMKHTLLSVICVLSLIACGPQTKSDKTDVKKNANENYIFFLHNRYVEDFGLDSSHPEYGKAEYKEIVAKFRKDGFTVISEQRKKSTDPKLYAKKVCKQIDSLLLLGVKPNHITVVGTSKGGYIAQFVMTELKNPEVNYVLIGCYQDWDLEELPEINFCGNILTIYEETDPMGVTAIKRKEASKLKVTRFREIQLHTGLKHGFLYHPMDEWMKPSEVWAKREYGKI